jgi:predicted house-cleaning noncanonical NTP pyrophosphatase (MazG superfamily)
MKIQEKKSRVILKKIGQVISNLSHLGDTKGDIYRASLQNLVFAVLAYGRFYNISEVSVADFQLKKREDKGSFLSKIYCHSFFLKIDDPSIEKYRKKKEEYPEIVISGTALSREYVGFSCNKLIRDKLIETMAGQGAVFFYCTLNHTDYVLSLHLKLREEYQELLKVKKSYKIPEKIANILEILLFL